MPPDLMYIRWESQNVVVIGYMVPWPLLNARLEAHGITTPAVMPATVCLN